MITKRCPFCKIEMIRPRADMRGFGVKKMGISENPNVKIDVLSNEVLVGDAPLFTFSDGKQKEVIKYYDYMCPQCSVVLFYGEKNNGIVREDKVSEVNKATGELRSCIAKSLPDKE